MPSGWQPVEEPMLQSGLKGHLLAEFPLSRGRTVFCSIQAFS